VGGDTATLVRHPLKFDGSVPPIRSLPPAIGEQTDEILHELGFTAAQAAWLRSEGVIHGTGHEAALAAGTG
jgi:crotonobetainyl-CoA:carnitine CoA-transferase CaiB-like acyl-CoA transferase